MLPDLKMDTRDESLPMSPNKLKQFVAFFGTSEISQGDIMRSDDFREDGDLCEEEEEEEEEGEDGEGNVSWQSGSTAVGSRLGLLEAIKEEESGDEKEAKSNSSLAERLQLGYFDIPLTKKAAPSEKPTPESISSPKFVTDLDTDHFGRPRTAERPTTPLPEKREQKRLEPSPFLRSSSPACIDCIASGAHHHHGRASVQSPPPPSRSGSVNGSLVSPWKAVAEASSEPKLAKETNSSNLTTPAKANPIIFATPPKPDIASEPSPSSFTTPPNHIIETSTPIPRRTVTLPIREYTPPREPAALKVAIPTPAPPKEPTPNPHEHPHEHPHERRLLNPTTPARQRAPAIPPTPPTTPLRRKSLPADFSGIRKASFNPPTPVEEENPSASSAIVDETEHGHGHGEDGYKCPFATRDRPPKEIRHSKSYTFRPGTPEFGRTLSHSYSASDISHRVSSSPEPSRLSTYNSYSRPTTPELSRLSHTYTHRRSSSLDGSRLARSYSRPTTPEVGFTGTSTRAPYVDVSEPVSRMPSPPPPTIASSVGTSPASSGFLQPPIDFKKDSTVRTAPRAVSRSISNEQLCVADEFFKSILEARHNRENESQDVEPEFPEEVLTPEIKPPEPEIPAVEIPRATTPEPKPAEPQTPVIHQNFIMVFVIPRLTKYYLLGPTFWNIIISAWLSFLTLGFVVAISTDFFYLFGDGTTSGRLRNTFFGEGELLEELSPAFAFLVYVCFFVSVTIFSRRVINPNPETRKSGLLAEFLGPRQAEPIEKFFSPKRLKALLLLCLIATGSSGLYLGAKVVVPLAGPPITAAVNKGVAAGMDYWNTLYAPAVEAPTEIEVQAAAVEPWDEMDLIYFQPDEKAGEGGKHVSSMEGGYGTYYPGSEGKGYHGDEDGLGWGTVIRIGLTLAIGPAGAMAWRQRRSM